MPAISKAALYQSNTTSFPNNNLGQITPANLRDFNDSMITSLVDEIPYGTYTASVNNSISAINTFTASQQATGSVVALNSFTSSQLTINTGINQFTQSANSSITQLNAQSASFLSWTSSINQIQSNGITLGNATRFNLVGSTTFFSASLVQNVNGAIATLTFTSDNSKLNTSSFNSYTSSTNTIISGLNTFTASQTSWNATATASISQLLTFSASLDATYATDAQLNAATASLINQINTKLNTSSFNAYTQSISGMLSGSFALLSGDNNFIGNQTISGSLYVSSSLQKDVTVEGQLWVSSSNLFLSGAANQMQINVVGAMQGTSYGSRSGSVTIRPASITITRGSANTTYGAAGFNVFADDPSNITYGTNTSQYTIAASDNATIDNEINLYADLNGTAFRDWDNTLGDYSTWLALTPNDGVNIPQPQFTRGLTFTGSVYGNVINATIASSTASIDLSTGNYFILTLAGTTKINVINPKPGVTATLVINTSTAASASFSSNVKQPSGSFYAASPSGNVDIISFTSVNGSVVYALPAQSFV
jgi:hypothetical protein